MKRLKSKIANLAYDEKESVLYVETFNEIEMTRENLEDHNKVIMEITGGKKHAAFVDVRFLYYIDIEGVQFASNSQAYDNRLAIAFYGGPLSNRLNIKLLEMQKNIKFPIQFFSSKEEGLKWIRECVRQHMLQLKELE